MGKYLFHFIGKYFTYKDLFEIVFRIFSVEPRDLKSKYQKHVKLFTNFIIRFSFNLLIKYQNAY